MAASNRGGMGAVVFDDGVSFRVWAPNAQSVAVAGDFRSARAVRGGQLVLDWVETKPPPAKAPVYRRWVG